MGQEVVTVLGAGAWGTALATLLAHNNYRVVLWCKEAEVAEEIEEHHLNNRYLPDVRLDEAIEPTPSLQHALAASQWVFEAIPVKFLRETLEAAHPFMRSEQIWVITSKGIEDETLLLPTAVVEDVLGSLVTTCVCAGPSFAKELAQELVTSVMIASVQHEIAKKLAGMLATSYFFPRITDDVMGVQVGGAMKNVIALAVGIIEGAGYKENTRAMLITQGLEEMGEIAAHFGGRHETIFGLSGVGDLVLTAMGTQSKNLRAGIMLGQGYGVEEITQLMGTLPEAFNTVKSIMKLVERTGMTLPLTMGTYEYIFEGRSARSFLERIVGRACKAKSYQLML